MSVSPSLRDLQLWLKWVITDPRGVFEALNNPAPNVEIYKSRYTMPTPSYLGFIVSDSTRSNERLDIYAEAYFSRILECMEKDFTRTKKVVGEDAFTKLVAEYLKAYPSKFTSIDEVGSSFARFISEFDDIAVEKWVADLALFEWNWIESFYAKEVEAKADWRSVFAMNPQAALQVHPSVSLVQSHWPIGELIQALDSGGAIGHDDFNKKLECSVVIYRFNDEVFWEELSPSIFQALKRLKNGTPLEDSFAQAHGIDLEVIFKTFSHWVERGIICGILTERNEVSV